MKLYHVYLLREPMEFRAANNEQELLKQLQSEDDRYNYMESQLNEIVLDGYTIVVTPDGDKPTNKGGRPRKEGQS